MKIYKNLFFGFFVSFCWLSQALGVWDPDLDRYLTAIKSTEKELGDQCKGKADFEILSKAISSIQSGKIQLVELNDSKIRREKFASLLDHLMVIASTDDKSKIGKAEICFASDDSKSPQCEHAKSEFIKLISDTLPKIRIEGFEKNCSGNKFDENKIVSQEIALDVQVNELLKTADEFWGDNPPKELLGKLKEVYLKETTSKEEKNKILTDLKEKFIAKEAELNGVGKLDRVKLAVKTLGSAKQDYSKISLKESLALFGGSIQNVLKSEKRGDFLKHLSLAVAQITPFLRKVGVEKILTSDKSEHQQEKALLQNAIKTICESARVQPAVASVRDSLSGLPQDKPIESRLTRDDFIAKFTEKVSKFGKEVPMSSEPAKSKVKLAQNSSTLSSVPDEKTADLPTSPPQKEVKRESLAKKNIAQPRERSTDFSDPEENIPTNSLDSINRRLEGLREQLRYYQEKFDKETDRNKQQVSKLERLIGELQQQLNDLKKSSKENEQLTGEVKNQGQKIKDIVQNIDDRTKKIKNDTGNILGRIASGLFGFSGSYTPPKQEIAARPKAPTQPAPAESDPGSYGAPFSGRNVDLMTKEYTNRMQKDSDNKDSDLRVVVQGDTTKPGEIDDELKRRLSPLVSIIGEINEESS